MSVLAVPLVAFYFGAGGIALLIDRRRAKRKVELSDDEASPEYVVESIDEIEDPDAK